VTPSTDDHTRCVNCHCLGEVAPRERAEVVPTPSAHRNAKCEFSTLLSNHPQITSPAIPSARERYVPSGMPVRGDSEFASHDTQARSSPPGHSKVPHTAPV
jgi:hypothetical protein